MMGRVRDMVRSALTVNVRMLPSKLGYFFYGGVLGLHIPFMTPFFVSVGLSIWEAGMIAGFKYTSSMLAGPMWGIIADRTGRRKLIMAVLFVGSAFPICLMPWIAKAIHPQTGNSTSCLKPTFNASAESWLAYANCRDEVETLFWTFLAMMIFASIFIGSMPGYVDTVVIQIVKEDPRKPSYGAQRIYGSIGFTVITQLGGRFADYLQIEGLSTYTATFILFLPCCIVMIPIGMYMVGQSKWETEEENQPKPQPQPQQQQPPESQPESQSPAAAAADTEVKITWENSITRKVLLMFKSFDFSFFMLTVFINGLANNMFITFSMNLATDTIAELRNDITKQTLIVVMGSAAEILVFPFSGRIIEKVGTSPCMIIGTFSYVLRFFAMAVTDRLWVFALVQTLHGLGFALAWSAMMEHTHKIAPKDIIVTVFGVLSGIYFSVSPFVVGVAGGWFYNDLGGQLLFKCTSGLMGLWTLFMLVYHGGKFLRKRQIARLEELSVRYRRSVNEPEVGGEPAYDIGIVNPLGGLDDETAEERLETMEEPF